MTKVTQYHGYVCAKCVSACLRPQGLQPTRLLCPWDSPGKSTGVGCHALLQGIFPPRDWTSISYVSCMDRQLLYHYYHHTVSGRVKSRQIFITALRCIYSVNKHDMSTCCMPHPALAPGHLGTEACKLQLLCLPSGRTCPHGDPGQKRQV